tara:strand:+ start:150 stop:491 length:342 start_codon:yes stop_codon:yes gene_type:complete
LLSEITKYISIITAVLLISSSVSFAEDKGAYFQEWDETAQRGFVSTSVVMAITIASQVDKELTHCIDDWYGEGETRRARQDQVLEIIRSRQAYQPNAVLLAIIQKACGKFPER